jgi:hypothetical protein
MKLHLYFCDLKPEHEWIEFSEVSFEHFNDKAQKALSAVGKATLHWHVGWSGETSKTVYFPETR